VLKKLIQKIRSWFTYCRGCIMGGKNAFMPLLARMAKATRGNAPHCLAEYQVYMQDEWYKEKVKEVFEREHPDKVGTKDMLNM
jgi:hypothetical protein